MIDSIALRLESLIDTNSKPLFKTVEGVLDMQGALEGGVKKDAVAFVFETGTTTSRNKSASGPIRQKQSINFGVCIGSRNRNDKTGAKGRAEIKRLRVQVEQALMGFVPTETDIEFDQEYEAIEVGSGSLVAIADNCVWWLCRFSTATYLRSTL